MLGHTVSLQVFTTTSNIREDQFIIFSPASKALLVKDQTTKIDASNAPIVAIVVDPKATINITIDNVPIAVMQLNVTYASNDNIELQEEPVNGPVVLTADLSDKDVTILNNEEGVICIEEDVIISKEIIEEL